MVADIRTALTPPGMLRTVKEAAAELRVSRSTVFALLQSGEIDSMLIGPKTRRIPQAALEDYVARKLAETAHETAQAS